MSQSHEKKILEDVERILRALSKLEGQYEYTTHRLEKQYEHIECRLAQIEREITREHKTPTSTRFMETTMNPTLGGNTQVFTGTFVPAGSVPPSDAVYAVTSNDPVIAPTVDATGLIVTGDLPVGWVESTTIPLAYTRTASSVSNPSWTLNDVITPSAPPAGFPTSTTFIQTQ